MLTPRRIKVMRDISKDSTPGYPWVMLGNTNAEVMESNGQLVWTEVERRMNYIVDNFEAVMEMGPEELVKSGACDPIKLFIKGEPHSQKKIVQGFLRIIAGVSLCDQILTRVISARQNKMEIANWETCPSKPGLGLHDEGLAKIAANARNILEKGRVMATDVSSWDWTVQEWELEADANRRIKLAGIDRCHPMAKLLLAHAHIVANSIYTDSDGNMFAQNIPGGQLSGDYNTGSTNSAMRVLASLAARYKADPKVFAECIAAKDLLICSMGDDTFELEVTGVPEVLEELGHIVKNVDYHDDLEGMEFCSQTFRSDGTAYPSDYNKTLFRFLSHAPDDAEYSSYKAQLMYIFRHMDQGTRVGIDQTALARVERARKLLSERNKL